MALTTERTSFSLDVLGRYVCNTWSEAMASADPATSADARPFDVVVIGGGTFGAAFAQQFFARDTSRAHRILVLEGGPGFLPEHVQNLGLQGVGVPAPTSIADLRAAGRDGRARDEVWGLPWHSSVKFPGLAYCLAGRSLYWGGWSPQLLPSETATWPAALVAELERPDRGYFRQAGEQIGVTETNDFLAGPLHDALRARLLQGLRAGTVADAVPLAELPLQSDPPEGTAPADREDWKVEAPLAVQARTRPGLFPFNKFSAMPLLVKAARSASVESGMVDRRKRLFVVPNCHVKRLVSRPEGAGRFGVTGIETNLGNLDLVPHAMVFLACGTIENVRLALASFADPAASGGAAIPNAALLGTNLMAHLRSNLTIRVPRAALGLGLAGELAASALFVKGRHRHADGSAGHFHLQITASGLGPAGTDSEAELFRKVPDLDGLDALRNASDTHVVITIRGIGEMTPHNPGNGVTLDPEADEFGVRRALVRFTPSTNDAALWDAMDAAAGQVAAVFAGGPPEVLARTRDGVGTTHHESGGLWIGEDPATSVTNRDGRFHHVGNAYALGPALFPTIGSPNPMLTGIALLRRTVHQILAAPLPAAEPEFETLFDGTAATFARWRAVGAGGFDLVGDCIVTRPGGDLGLLFYDGRRFDDFTLRVELMLERGDENSGVFVRFRDPRLPVPDPNDAARSTPYNNPAWVPVTTGFEVQIDDLARDDGADQHRSGAIYGVPIGPGAGRQDYRQPAALGAGRWHELEIEVSGDDYTTRLRPVAGGSSQVVTQFTNAPGSGRGRSSHTDPASGFIGLQSHSGRVWFRAIRVRVRAAAGLAPEARKNIVVTPQSRATREGAPDKGTRHGTTPKR